MAHYSIEDYRKALPNRRFQMIDGKIKYLSDDGTWFIAHATYLPKISEEEANIMRSITIGTYKEAPTGILAVVAQAEKEAALRKQIEALEEELEAIEADESEAPTLYVVSFNGHNGLKETPFAFVSTSEEEAELWYQLRGLVRSEHVWGHGFAPAGVETSWLSGRVNEVEFSDSAYAEALTAYIARLRA